MRARALLLLAGGLAGAACADTPAIAPLDDSTAWRFAGIPKVAATRFSAVQLDGASALRIEADASYGLRVHAMAGVFATEPLHWQWRVEQLNEAADLTRRAGDDTTLKVCALFEMAIDRVPFVERQLLRLARLLSGEPLPAATVCYVWDAWLETGATLPNAYSRRVRYVVARGAGAPLQRWLDERRDLAADFRRLFGDEASELPPLAAIAVGADADNTRSRSVGYVRALRWGTP